MQLKNFLKVMKEHGLVINIGLTVINVLFVLQANSISRANIGFEIDKTSREHVSQAYNDLYKDVNNKSVIYKIKDGQKVENKDATLRVVDVLEEIGSDFCQGTAKARHIRIYLENTLAVMCKNQEMIDYFSGQKNGLAMLCYEFFPDSGFAKTLVTQEIKSCEFIDSSKFPNGQNAKRFEFK